MAMSDAIVQGRLALAVSYIHACSMHLHQMSAQPFVTVGRCQVQRSSAFQISFVHLNVCPL